MISTYTGPLWFIFLILVCFQVKHFVADYLWQTPYMLGKFHATAWKAPLAAHAWVHFMWTLALVSIFTFNPLLGLVLGVVDFVVHFTMDRVKASPTMLGRYKALSATEMVRVQFMRNPWGEGYDSIESRFAAKREAALKLESNKKFWWALGFDQMVHHLTDLGISFLVLQYGGDRVGALWTTFMSHCK